MPVSILLMNAGLGRAENDNPVLIGQNAAPFTLNDTAGQTVSLKEFAGRPVVLSFFGNACAPCRAEAVHLSRFQETYQRRGLVVLSVNAWDEPAADVNQFAKGNKLSHRILVQGGSVARQKYRLGPVPTTFWIDRQGRIVHQIFGFNEKELGDMEAWIKKIVAN